jgi:altronate hydrolase
MGRSARETIGLVVPLVFCENRNIAVLKQPFQAELGFAQPNIYRQQAAELVRLYAEGKRKTIETHALEPESDPPTRPKVLDNVDGIKFLMHEGGCGGTREDANNLCGLLAVYIHHPNVAGATVLSLGCQKSQIEILHEQIARRNPHFSKPMFVFEQQPSGSEFKMLSELSGRLSSGSWRRTKVSVPPPLSLSLVRGFEVRRLGWVFRYSCESAVGRVSDALAALGRRSLLSEFPELCGVEQELVSIVASGGPSPIGSFK